VTVSLTIRGTAARRRARRVHQRTGVAATRACAHSQGGSWSRLPSGSLRAVLPTTRVLTLEMTGSHRWAGPSRPVARLARGRPVAPAVIDPRLVSPTGVAGSPSGFAAATNRCTILSDAVELAEAFEHRLAGRLLADRSCREYARSLGAYCAWLAETPGRQRWQFVGRGLRGCAAAALDDCRSATAGAFPSDTQHPSSRPGSVRREPDRSARSQRWRWHDYQACPPQSSL
jgi:hypothetical protein